MSHRFKNLVDGTAPLQYKLELFLAGMIPPTSPTNIQEYLDKLIRCQKNWNDFTPACHRTFPDPPLGERPIRTEVCDNLFVETYTPPGSLEPSRLVFCQVSPYRRKDYPDIWEVRLAFRLISSVFVCTAQDLLIVAQPRCGVTFSILLHVYTAG